MSYDILISDCTVDMLFVFGSFSCFASSPHVPQECFAGFKEDAQSAGVVQLGVPSVSLHGMPGTQHDMSWVVMRHDIFCKSELILNQTDGIT